MRGILSYRPRVASPIASLVIASLLDAPRIAGAAWDPGGNLLAGPLGNTCSHLVVSDGRGGAWGLWADLGITDVVHGGRLGIDGTRPSGWPLAGRTILAPPQAAGSTAAAPDGDGGIYVATSYSLSSFQPSRPLYVTRVDEDGMPVAGWTESGAVIANSAHPKVGSVMSPDGAHGAYLAWLDAIQSTIRGDEYAGVHEVRVVRLAPAGGVAPGWPDSGLRVSVAPPTAVVSSDLQLAIAGDATDGLYVAWVDSTDGVGDLRVQHLDGDGSVASGWPDGGQIVAIPTTQRRLGAIAPDGAGGLLVGWTETGVGSAHARVTRFDPGGTLATGWPVEGVRLCSGCGYAGAEAVAPDGLGGMHAIVGEVSTTTGEDLYIYHVLASGAVDPAFPSTGAVVANEPAYEVARGAVADGAGGTFLLWESDRYGSAPARSVFAIRLLPNGAPAPGWTAGGILLGDSTAMPEYLPAGLFTERSGAAMAWWVSSHDFSQSDSLYAYRLGADADPTTSAIEPVGTLALTVAPNPSMAGTRVAFSLPVESAVSVEVFDVRGRHVRTLANERMAAGPHRIAWTEDADDGRVVAAGVYWLRVSGPGWNATRRIVKLD